jgi:hypothetical protein
MKWRWPTRPVGNLSHSQSQEPRTERQKSLALQALTSRLRTGERYNILDLGSSVGQNVDFFSEFCGKLYVQDLYDDLISFDYFSPSGEVELDKIYRYLLPFNPGTRFDIVFSWDLFNYLEENECRGLMKHLATFCRPDTLVLSMISTRKSIAERPAKYRILDSQTITCENRTGIMKSCPCYREPQLARMMPAFKVLNSFLLRRGFKEYLFSFAPQINH